MIRTVVVIPVYEGMPKETEKISLRRCLKVLSNHSICLIAPEGLDISYYKSVFDKENIPFLLELFPPVFFKGIAGYNKLMLSKDFYKRFEAWEYMLIYQLDAYVFSDKLNEWASKGYDYIGAPWKKRNGEVIKDVSGNGGFSLRKTQSFISLFSSQGKLLSYKGLCSYYTDFGFLYKWIYILLGLLFTKYNSITYFTHLKWAEDLFFARLSYKKVSPFKIPGSDVAKFFSIELYPGYWLKENNNQLPFGCHGWEKGDNLTFWRDYIPEDL
ncbi:hypothetical protein M2480_001367 [Parabacteroides sp. PFB2-12]|uniref:DUF5672 family protein n=1 Tax=unclassified Parabacteroides TaxID=2649774 RepID=UPI002475017F|nr:MULTISPECIES: DUF5672 family protein [unclassified Parabacteroides]MDH6343378.1 hypothetical protein [Parabacteroides sp. PM6-13]MDH6390394.1 hypothetical protein [Parabacteroides sp. PFB2-12]